MPTFLDSSVTDDSFVYPGIYEEFIDEGINLFFFS